VDRLLKSPSKQRGRDFAIMLATLSDLGYIVEWRVINAADYGMPQRRRRVFFLGYHKSSPIYKKFTKLKSAQDWILKEGLFAKAFPVVIGKKGGIQQFGVNGDVVEVSNQFNKKGASLSPFRNSGIIINRIVHTIETAPSFVGPPALLGDILVDEDEVPGNYFIEKGAIEQWEKLKGAKKEKRVNKSTGFEYQYNEGSMVFPDPLDKPSRTIITGEGGSSPSRFKHVIKAGKGKLRRLTPVELERLNMFPDNHTEGATDIKRAFFMGNALVVGIIEKVASVLKKEI
jgi:DNA (cytosine-5)-methyltransferase 1